MSSHGKSVEMKADEWVEAHFPNTTKALKGAWKECFLSGHASRDGEFAELERRLSPKEVTETLIQTHKSAIACASEGYEEIILKLERALRFAEREMRSAYEEIGFDNEDIKDGVSSVTGALGDLAAFRSQRGEG